MYRGPLRVVSRWHPWNTKSQTSVPRLTCKCAALAQESSSTHFGLQFYGECWVGNMTVTPQAKTPIQNNCIGHNGVNLFPGPCGPQDEWECVGEHLSNYVYRLTPGTLNRRKKNLPCNPFHLACAASELDTRIVGCDFQPPHTEWSAVWSRKVSQSRSAPEADRL